MALDTQTALEIIRKSGEFIARITGAYDDLYNQLQAYKSADEITDEALRELQSTLANSPLLTTGPSEQEGEPVEGNTSPAKDAAIKAVDEIEFENPEGGVIDSSMEETVDTVVETTVEDVVNAFDEAASVVESSEEEVPAAEEAPVAANEEE